MDNNITYVGPIYFPDGRPAPLVLTEEETIILLRLDNGPKRPKYTLQYYREEGLLGGIRIGKRIRYPLEEIIKFLRRQGERINKDSIDNQ